MDNRPPPPYVSPKGMWATKLSFRILSVICSLVIIGLAAYMTADWYSGLSSYYFSGGTPIIVLGPPAAVGIIWDVAEAICIIARRGHRGMHPGSIVAIDLLLWLGFIAAAVMFGLFHLFSEPSSTGFYYDELMSLVYISRAGIAFSALEVIFHFTLFVFGCRETAIRNRRPPMVVYSGAPQMAPGAHPYSQYGAPIMLPVGQAPPAGYVPYAYGPTDANGQQKPVGYPALAVSPPPQEPSPVHTAGNDEWRNSYQVSNGTAHETPQHQTYNAQQHV